MSPATGRRLGLLASLYLSQGLPYGFFVQALPVLLRKLGLGLPAIGAASWLALPWMLKFLWAPLVDRAPPGALGLGRRRAWLLPLQAAGVLGLAALALVDPATALGAVMVGVLFTNLIAATQDIASDGLAVELLEPEERPAGNSVQVAAYRVGMIISGSALLYVFDVAGWAPTLLSMAALLVMASLPVLLWSEPVRPLPPAPPPLSPLSAITRPGMLAWLGLLVAFKAGEALGSGMFRPYLVDAGLGLSEIGGLMGAGGFSAGLVGALLGGWLSSRLGPLRAAALGGLGQAIAVGLWAVPALLGPRPALLWTAALAEPLLSGVATVSIFTAMMRACRRDQGQSATDYTLQASAFVLASLAPAGLSGLLAESLGYPTHFALSAAITLCGALLMATQGEQALRRLE